MCDGQSGPSLSTARPDARHHREAATRALLAVLLTAALAACGIGVSGALPADEVPPPIGFPECNADAYDFAGQGTLRQLGLDKATPVPPPDPDQPAMIWVTHDLKPHDFGAPGGEVEMVRMLCFEFPDGSGGSEWPVHPDWRPPIADAQSTETSSSGFPAALLVAGLTAAVLLTVSLVGSEAQMTADKLDALRSLSHARCYSASAGIVRSQLL